MLIDGYAVLAVNEKGEKARVIEHRCHDERLDQNVQWSDMNLEECLLPEKVSDCLVMVFFSYHSYAPTHWEGDYEERLEIEHCIVMQEGYKEFEREQISFLITHGGHAEWPREYEENEEEWINEALEDWETLHDTDFVLHEKYNRKEASPVEVEMFGSP